MREYAAKFISTPGKHDGLYWPPEDQADISPLDGFVEDADLAARSDEKPEPYNGYYFRILTAQGPAAPGGAHSYLINGHMIAGHAMVAWPATYGDSGVETFICGENGDRLPEEPGAEHRCSRRFDERVQSRLKLDGRRIAASRKSAASFREGSDRGSHLAARLDRLAYHVYLLPPRVGLHRIEECNKLTLGQPHRRNREDV